MNTPDQKTFRLPNNTGLQVLSAFVFITLLVPTPAFSRKMECSYDFITHVTTLHLDDKGRPNGSISYELEHSISPIGGEEMFLFSKGEPSQLKGTGLFQYIEEKVFFDPRSAPSSILFVDFGRPTLKALQFPASVLEQSFDEISAPLVVWSCHRTD